MIYAKQYFFFIVPGKSVARKASSRTRYGFRKLYDQDYLRFMSPSIKAWKAYAYFICLCPVGIGLNKTKALAQPNTPQGHI